jgi:hypothetical protein
LSKEWIIYANINIPILLKIKFPFIDAKIENNAIKTSM